MRTTFFTQMAGELAGQRTEEAESHVKDNWMYTSKSKTNTDSMGQMAPSCIKNLR